MTDDDSDLESDEPAEGQDKAPDAFRTISEVAEDLDLPQHVLRFWETRFAQIKPLKRGGGRRYYRPQDIELLRGIRALLYGEGYTIRGVQRILRENGLRAVLATARGSQESADPEHRGKPAPIVDVGPDDDEDEAEEMAPGIAEGGAGVRTKKREPFLSPMPEPEAAVAASAAIATQDLRLLEATLADLLECKRLLDQAR
jgi:DNA-binding transcriptional MerR regulator